MVLSASACSDHRVPDKNVPPWEVRDPEPDLLKLRRTAEALGWLVTAWGLLEADIDVLLLRLIGTRFIYEITGNVDFREKLAIIKAIGFEVHPAPRWFARLEAAVNQIDGKLRPERNRMIHDLWVFPNAQHQPMIRFGLTPKLRRPQSRQREQTRDILPVSPEEIWELVKSVARAAEDLRRLTVELPRSSREKSD